MEWNQVKKIAAIIMAVGAAASVAHADGNDALLNKLVSKGILTQQEAAELKKDAVSPNATTTVVRGLGLPDWVTGLKFYGDFRGRFEEQTAESDDYTTRPRYRYRVRLGLVANMTDNFEIGFRAASGNPLTGFQVGSPVTANQDMNSLESRKPLWIDAAYAKWSPLVNWNGLNVTGVIGKFDNPFLLSNMIWDYDIVPEGAGLTLSYDLTKQHTIRGIGGVFVLDELNQTGSNPSHDPYVFGGQVLLESKWTPSFETALGGAIFSIDARDSLRATGTGAQPFFNAGNTRIGTGADAGVLVNNYKPVIGTFSATYKFDHFPLYPGKFPIKVSGEYMNNTVVSKENEGWRAGITFGKAGKRNAWEINYRYQHLEADAWFDALTDDDNGAFYEKNNPQLAGTGKTSGWFGGTNVKGHQIIATYSFTDAMNLSFIYYLNDLILTQHHAVNGAQHFMVDMNWKF